MIRIVTVETLHQIRDAVLGYIRKMSFKEFHESLDLKEYHGFGKADFNGDWVEEILARHGLGREEIQVDIIYLWTDLTDQIHQHHKSRAEIYVLGEREHLPNPMTAEAYLKGRWHRVFAGNTLGVSPSEPHGFRIPGVVRKELSAANDKLYFLSLQNPPIVTAEYDDYHLVETMAPDPKRPYLDYLDDSSFLCE
jgi:hypothetical protein